MFACYLTGRIQTRNLQRLRKGTNQSLRGLPCTKDQIYFPHMFTFCGNHNARYALRVLHLFL